MKQPLIKCSGAGFGYEHFDVVTDVTMEILPGDYIGVVGENGAGKSTLIKGLLGLLKPTSGSIVMADDLKKTGIGYLPQQTAAQKEMCIRDSGGADGGNQEKQEADPSHGSQILEKVVPLPHGNSHGEYEQGGADCLQPLIELSVFFREEPVAHQDSREHDDKYIHLMPP